MVTMPDQQNDDPALDRARLAARAEAHAGLIAEHLTRDLGLPAGLTLEFDTGLAASHVDTVARTLALAAYARGAGVCYSDALELATSVDTRGPASSDRLIAWMREAERQARSCAEYEHDPRT